MNPYYAGIGSRETPPDILKLMTAIAAHKREAGQILRSGGAKGADYAFEVGAGEFKEIFTAGGPSIVPHHFGPPSEEAIRIAAKHHPAWSRCSAYAKLLHGRNTHIILGRNLDEPVFEVVCWTPNASASGGTGQGIRIARAYDIPIIDLADPECLKIYKDLR